MLKKNMGEMRYTFDHNGRAFIEFEKVVELIRFVYPEGADMNEIALRKDMDVARQNLAKGNFLNE